MLVPVNGVMLNVEDAGEGRPLLLLHGFTGSCETWVPFAAELVAHGFRSIGVDLLGHGGSDTPTDPARYGAEHAAHDLLTLLDLLGIQRTLLLGYSMGGRVALQLAVSAPERIEALVLESASPGIADPAERAARVQADEGLAAFIEQAGVEAFVDRWERLPLLRLESQVSSEARAAVRAQRLRNRAHGLANSLRGLGAGRQRSLWDELHRVQVPTLLIAGARDEKYTGAAEAMLARMPRARSVVLPHAGHTAHVDQLERFLESILTFFGASNGMAQRHLSHVQGAAL